MIKPKHFLLILFAFLPLFIYAFQPKSGILNIEKNYPKDTIAENVYPYKFEMNVFAGIYHNGTFGSHPLFGIRIGKKVKKSFFNLVWESRLGKSKNTYNYLFDDKLNTTDDYNGVYAGIEYDRLLFNKNNHQVSLISGIGLDGIKIEQDGDEYQRLNGLAVNLGLGYLFKVKNYSGPHIQLLYHLSNIKNEGGTYPEKNSLVIRLTYALGY